MKTNKDDLTLLAALCLVSGLSGIAVGKFAWADELDRLQKRAITAGVGANHALPNGETMFFFNKEIESGFIPRNPGPTSVSHDLTYPDARDAIMTACWPTNGFTYYVNNGAGDKTRLLFEMKSTNFYVGDAFNGSIFVNGREVYTTPSETNSSVRMLDLTYGRKPIHKIALSVDPTFEKMWYYEPDGEVLDLQKFKGSVIVDGKLIYSTKINPRYDMLQLLVEDWAKAQGGKAVAYPWPVPGFDGAFMIDWTPLPMGSFYNTNHPLYMSNRIGK